MYLSRGYPQNLINDIWTHCGFQVNKAQTFFERFCQQLVFLKRRTSDNVKQKSLSSLEVQHYKIDDEQ